MSKERYLFLGGHRKCGTTMLLNLFDGHEECCVYPTDISVLYGYFPHYTIEEHSTQERLDRLEKVIFGTLKKLSDKHGLSNHLALEAMRKAFFDSLDTNRLTEIDYIIRQMVAAFRIATRQPVETHPLVVLKETSLEIYAQELSGYFKDAQFIQLVRDPRDNYAALLAGADKHYKQFGESKKHLLASLLHRVGISWKLSGSNLSVLGSDRFLSMRFEDTTANLDGAIETIVGFSKINPSSCFKRPTVMGVPTSGNNYDGEKFTRVTTRNVGRWQERIGSFEAQVIEFHLGEMMEAHGYACHSEPCDRAKAASEFYKWSNYRYFFKDSFKLL
jgi:hypothetical protein